MNSITTPGAGASLGTSQKMDPQKHRFLMKLSLIIAGGMFIDGFILGGIGLVMPALTEDLGLSGFWQGLIGSSALIGIFFGGPIGGYLADRFGRKPMFIFTLAIFMVGSVAQFFVMEPWQLFAVRVLMGVAIGADYAIGWPLLAEFSPARLRGKLLAFQEVIWFVGYLASYAVGYFMSTAITVDWRIILGMSTIPSVIVFLLRLGTPESPRWLISKGRVEESRAIAAQYMEDVDALEVANEKRGTTSFWRLFSPEYRKNTIFVCVYWATNITPYFAIGTFAPIVLEHLGIEDGLTGAFALNGLAVVGTLIAVFLIEHVGRRMLSIPPMWIATAALVIIGLFSHLSPIIVLTCFLVFALVNAISSALTGVYPGEIFPTEIRGAGVGLGTAFSRIGAAVGTFLLPLSMSSLGIEVTMLFAAAVCGLGAITAQFLAPETKGLTLAEASAPVGNKVPAGK
ncbi:MFS transporter [Paenarthrobacter nitroguajacolicus]